LIYTAAKRKKLGPEYDPDDAPTAKIFSEDNYKLKFGTVIGGMGHGLFGYTREGQQIGL
jgi:hypothetical protein